MKKLLIFLGFLVIPSIALATNNVTLTTDTIISVGGHTLTISGSSASINSITVGASSFTVVLGSGSSIKVSSADRAALSSDAGTDPYTMVDDCQTGSSNKTLSTTGGSATVTVTPLSTACDATVTTTSTSSGGGNGAPVSNGGGGGGGYAPQIAQVQNQAMSANPNLPTGTSKSNFVPIIKSLTVGTKNSDVMRLQKILNADTDTKVAISGVGSLGKETTLFGPATKKALMKFQVKYGIAKPGVAGYGNFGPKTKAKINEIANLKNL